MGNNSKAALFYISPSGERLEICETVELTAEPSDFTEPFIPMDDIGFSATCRMSMYDWVDLIGVYRRIDRSKKLFGASNPRCSHVTTI